jgi:hypothetical protein
MEGVTVSQTGLTLGGWRLHDISARPPPSQTQWRRCRRRHAVASSNSHTFYKGQNNIRRSAFDSRRMLEYLIIHGLVAMCWKQCRSHLACVAVASFRRSGVRGPASIVAVSSISNMFVVEHLSSMVGMHTIHVFAAG